MHSLQSASIAVNSLSKSTPKLLGAFIQVYSMNLVLKVSIQFTAVCPCSILLQIIPVIKVFFVHSIQPASILCNFNSHTSSISTLIHSISCQKDIKASRCIHYSLLHYSIHQRGHSSFESHSLQSIFCSHWSPSHHCH